VWDRFAGFFVSAGEEIFMGADSLDVFVFRMWDNTNTVEGWAPGPRLLVHVAAGGSPELEHLSWTTEDGTECALAFAPGMSTCAGHRRDAEAHVVAIRGELDETGSARQDAAELPAYEFDTEFLDVQWHKAGPLRLLVDDGREAPPRWVSWRDRSGLACSLGLWSPSWSGESDQFKVAGMTLKKASVFAGYRQPGGEVPAVFRGIWGNAAPAAPTIVEEPGEPEPLPEVPDGTPELPALRSVPLVRTDFSDDEAWAAAHGAVTADREMSFGEVFSANVEPLDDNRFAGLSAGQLAQLVPEDTHWSLLLVADEATMTSPEHHVLVVDLHEELLGRTFRATPPAVQEIENNLSIANMDWEDFADSADPDGIVRPMLT
jgi:hypothetical protein